MTIQEMENIFSKLDGKDPEDYEDLHDHIQDEDDIYNESYVFDKGNYEQNLDKWAPGTPLWIAGASGDGKSTLAKKYAKEHKATLAPLDIFLCRIAGTKEKFEKCLKDDTGTVMNEGSKIILDYIDKHPEITWAKSGDEYFDRGQNPELWNQLFNWLLKVTKNDPKYNKNLYIFEGCSICMMDIDKAKKLPIIVTGTSRLTGSRRRMHRDTEEHSDYSILKVIWRELKRITSGNFKKLNDNKDKFIKNLSKTIQESDENTTKGYRYTDGRDGEGIYEALKSEMYQKNGLSPAPWREFLDSDACKWLPKPPKYNDNNESWFTEEGNEKFKELTLPIVKEYIKNIKMETKDIPNERIVYSDEYQFVVDNSIPVHIQEAKLSTKERNKLDDSEFGIPELRKYPLTDKKHVRSAVSYFHKAPRKYKVQLAKRILRAAHKYGMDTEDWDTINEYAHKKHIRVQEFVDPIAKLKDDVYGSMNFMNYLMKIDLLTKGSVSESLKQLKHSAPNGLHPIMFMGYMDPEGVNMSDLKDLEKQVVYADDEGNLYSCFFNSHARRHEISQIASSFDAFISDMAKRKVSQPNLVKAYANPLVELKKDDRVIHSHREIPFTSLDNGSDGCYMNTYYSYFAILEAFEFKRNQIYRDICNVILDQFDSDESKFDFRSIEVNQINWATAEILFRFKYDNDSFVVVIPTVAMKTEPAKLYHDNSPKNENGDAYVNGKDFETIDEDNHENENEDASMTEMCIGSNEYGVCYQEFDDNGKIKITNLPYDMMYFGSFKDFGNNMLKLQNPRLFVTPFKGIASIFTVDRSRYMIPKGKSCNLAYDEWQNDISELDKPFDSIHVKVQGIPEMEHRSFDNEGWIYGVDVSKLKDHIYQEPWMDSEREFLILDVDEIPIAMKLNHKSVVYVEGADRKDVREAPKNENVFYSNHRVSIDEKSVKKYMKKGNANLTIGLQHLHVNDKVKGYLWDTKDGDIVAYVAVEEKKDGNWIVALELADRYQSKGYGKQLLEFAETELNADHLSVNKNNKRAIALYSENGWSTYKDDDTMVYMKKNTADEPAHESLIPLKRENKEWEHDNREVTFDNPNIYMRPATEDDIENMYQWEMESIDKSLVDNEKVQSLIRQDCHDSLKDTQMIMDGEKTIGMFTACMIDNGEWRYIGEIYLIPEYRGQHIGSTILRNEIENYDKIRLQVAMDNENAMKLYTSLGFKIVKENEEGQMYIMEYIKPENFQETVTVDGHRLIELAYFNKITNLTPEQEQIVKDYANARDQLQAAAAYYTRETKARKKSLKRMQLEHNTSKSEYQRDQLNRKMARTRIELDVLARDYAEAYQRNVQTMNELADKFDEIELSKKDQTRPSPINDNRDSITIPIPKILRKPRELLGSFLKFEDENIGDEDTDV